MPRGITGGVTAREFLKESIMHTILRSHSVATGDMVSSMGLRALSAKMTQVSLYSPSGQRYIICSESVANGPDVAAR